MLRELLSIFRSGKPLAAIADNFTRMLSLALENTLTAGRMVFDNGVSPEERTHIYEQDVAINKLERTVRKQVVAHLSLQGNTLDVPYCLLMMSLVKDVERLGDYAKNLTEVKEMHPDALPEDTITKELKEIRREVEAIFEASADVFSRSDREQALEFVERGKDLAHRCDALFDEIARSAHGPTTVTALVLATRYYKRIGGHLRNILTSVVMPLHKVDYFDEKEVAIEEGGKASGKTAISDS